MARPAETPEYHQLVGTRATRADNTPSPFTGGRPSCPSYLSPIAKTEWRRIVRLLRERGTLTRGDGPAIEVYCQTYARWRACITEIETKGDFIDTTWTDLTGTHTKRTINPASKLAGQLANSLRAMQVQLGATPGSRGEREADEARPEEGVSRWLGGLVGSAGKREGQSPAGGDTFVMTDDEYQLYIIQARKPMLEAAGLWSDSYDAMQVLILAGVVTHDPEVWRLSWLPDFKIIDDPVDEFCSYTTDWVRLFAAMGPRSRAELAARIKNRHGKK
jgi:P27 family predicted phage terminase small subunit